MVRETPKPDPQQFIRLFVESERRIYGYIVSLLPNLVEAEDVLQETSLVLWQKFGDFEPGTDFMAWACSIARFKVIDHYRKRTGSKVTFSQAAIDALVDQYAQEAPGLDARHRALAECLGKLSPTEQMLLKERYGEGASVKSLAKAVGRSADAIYKALARVHETLFNCVRLTMLREARQ